MLEFTMNSFEAILPQFDTLDDQSERVALFNYFNTNLPDAASREIMEAARQLPIFPSWSQKRITLEGVLGICAANLVGSMACPADDLPAHIKVK
jgi:hypothetical protein